MKLKGIRILATLLAIVIVSSACGSDDEGDSRKPEPPTTAAAALRATMDLLFREHVYLLGITTENGVTAQIPLFEAAAAALEESTLAIADQFEKTYGERGQDGFLKAWRPYIDLVGQYANRTARKLKLGNVDRAFSQAAGRIASFAASVTPLINPRLMGTRLRDLLGSVRAAVDAQVGKDYAKADGALRTAADRASEIAATFARAFADDLPASYPGDPLSPASSLRRAIEAALTDHVYLVGLTTENIITGQPRPRDGAKAALDAASAALAGHIGASYGTEAGEAFAPLWKHQVDLLLAYGGSAEDEAKREQLRRDLEQYATDAATFLAGLNEALEVSELERLLGAHGHAMTQAIDAQVAKDHEQAYLRLRSAAAQVEALGARLAAVTVERYPVRFLPTPSILPG